MPVFCSFSVCPIMTPASHHAVGVTPCHCTSRVHNSVLFIFSLSHYDISLTAHCNSACHCSTDVFTPVCDENNTLYFSPCHAGCTSRTQDGAVSVASLCVESSETLSVNITWLGPSSLLSYSLPTEMCAS